MMHCIGSMVSRKYNALYKSKMLPPAPQLRLATNQIAPIREHFVFGQDKVTSQPPHSH
jgi:hypothetical protein